MGKETKREFNQGEKTSLEAANTSVFSKGRPFSNKNVKFKGKYYFVLPLPTMLCNTLLHERVIGSVKAAAATFYVHAQLKETEHAASCGCKLHDLLQ